MKKGHLSSIPSNQLRTIRENLIGAYGDRSCVQALPSNIKEYLISPKDEGTLDTRIGRCIRILDQEIVERFMKNLL